MSSKAAPHVTRRALVGTGAAGALGALALVACTGDSSTEDPWQQVGARPQPVSAEGLDLGDVLPGRQVESPDFAFEVSTSGLFSAFTRDEMKDMMPRAAPPAEGLTAPEGSAYLVATFDERYLDDERWPPEAEVPVRQRIAVTDAAGERTVLELDPELRETEWLLQVPADPDPQDAVLEIDLAGKVRRLSLVDGSVVHDDLAYLADRPRSAEMLIDAEEHEPLLEAESVDEDGATDSVSIGLGRVVLLPASTDHGWPTEGTLFLGVTVHHAQFLTPSREQLPNQWPLERLRLPSRPEGCTLTLPDGTEAVQIATEVAHGGGVVDGQYDAAVHRIWFEVPVDIGTAAVQLRLSLCPRREELAEILGIRDGAGATLTVPQEEQ